MVERTSHLFWNEVQYALGASKLYRVEYVTQRDPEFLNRPRRWPTLLRAARADDAYSPARLPASCGCNLAMEIPTCISCYGLGDTAPGIAREEPPALATLDCPWDTCYDGLARKVGQWASQRLRAAMGDMLFSEVAPGRRKAYGGIVAAMRARTRKPDRELSDSCAFYGAIDRLSIPLAHSFSFVDKPASLGPSASIHSSMSSSVADVISARLGM